MTAYQIIILLMGISLSAFAKSVQNTVEFHFEESILYKLKSKWFGPAASTYTNKDSISKNPIISWLFQNPLVFVTDEFHCTDFMEWMSMPTAVVLAFSLPWWYLGCFWLVFTCVFSAFFTYIWKK